MFVWNGLCGYRTRKMYSFWWWCHLLLILRFPFIHFAFFKHALTMRDVVFVHKMRHIRNICHTLYIHSRSAISQWKLNICVANRRLFIFIWHSDCHSVVGRFSCYAFLLFRLRLFNAFWVPIETRTHVYNKTSFDIETEAASQNHYRANGYRRFVLSFFNASAIKVTTIADFFNVYFHSQPNIW